MKLCLPHHCTNTVLSLFSDNKRSFFALPLAFENCWKDVRSVYFWLMLFFDKINIKSYKINILSVFKIAVYIFFFDLINQKFRLD